MHTLTRIALAIPVLGVMFTTVAQADEQTCFYESRSGDTGGIECATYHSEISNTRAFLETIVKRGKWTDPQLRPVIIDVRSTPEYKAGHPEHAYNVPYPYIYQECKDVGPDPADPNKLTVAGADGSTENDRTVDGACVSTKSTLAQLPQDFVDYVKKIVPNKNTPIYTMCRTGVRSVGAANRLEEAGYTNVRNMWEGFVGVNLKAPFYVRDANGVPVVPTQTVDMPVDLNHDGVLTDADKNGWLYHLALPVDKRLLPPLIYKPRADTYKWN
jgi:rhodanese-related sulfurtransferase